MARRKTDSANANLARRLPRERPTQPIMHNGMTVLERAEEFLGDRLKMTRSGWLLDGRPASTDAVMAAAGLKYADEDY